jgi:hypothetical protein
MRRTPGKAVPVVILGLYLLAGCTQSKAADRASAPPTGGTGVVVTGRAHSPTQQDAKGLGFTTGSIGVTVAGHRISIGADDWNTIVDTSTVPRIIGLTVDPTFHLTLTGQNRFQYLADRLAEFAPQKFDPVGIVAAPLGRSLVIVVALLNATNTSYQLSGFHVSVTANPPETLVGTGKFYKTESTSPIILAHSVAMMRLTTPVIHAPPKTATVTSYEFRWDRLQPCSTDTC